MYMDKLMAALQRLHELLDRYRIGYIVVGSLADYLLGVPAARPRDIDVLISARDAEKVGTLTSAEPGISTVVPIGYRESSRIRGLYGRFSLASVTVDILANIYLRYGGRWIPISYEDLLPCTLEVKLTGNIAVRIPCPEIQLVADKALGRLERAETLASLINRDGCRAKLSACKFLGLLGNT